jgi:hypothetical protein
MSYKSDHEFRTEIWQEVTRGLPANIIKECHKQLGDSYGEEKDKMGYDDLLAVVKEVLDDYSEWSWNGQRWFQ